jgi:lactoylglutathione lyase
MVTKFLHARYRVDDLEKTCRFYREVLGLQESNRQTSSRGSTLVFFKAPESDTQIEICHYPASGKVNVQYDLTHLAFEVDSIEKFALHSTQLGHPLTDGPIVSESGTKFAFIDAPEGYEIELIERKK